jgi:hypothetical protein
MKALASQHLSVTCADRDASLKINVLFPADITGVCLHSVSKATSLD